MTARLKLDTVPQAYQAMRGLQAFVDDSGLDHRLLELVKIRASQINGCAFCIAMHVTDARKLGEADLRLHLVRVWREAPIFTERERAALALTEAVTELRDGDVPDSVYAAARAQFSDAELIALVYGIVAINSWNRLCITFRIPPTLPRELMADSPVPAGPSGTGDRPFPPDPSGIGDRPFPPDPSGIQHEHT
jgi:AhpD family alkylhydroperoxidase